MCVERATRRGRITLLGAVVILIILPSLAIHVPQSLTGTDALNQSLIAEPHFKPVLPENSSLTGPLSPSTSLYVTISFSLRNEQKLASLIAEQSTPGSPYFHRYLTREQFYSNFGPNLAVISEVISYFRSFGIQTVNLQTPLTLGLRGTAAEMQAAFHTHLDYLFYNNSKYYLNSEPLMLPASFADYISSINGLTDLPKIQSAAVHLPFSSHMYSVLSSSTAAANASISSVVNFTHPGYLYTNSSFPYGITQFLNPSDFPVLFNATPLFKLGDLGQGTSIAIVLAQGYNPSDLSTFSQQVFNNSNQILSRLTAIPVPGESGNASIPGASFLKSADAFEMTLDIEYASVMAPDAHIYAVFGPSLSLASLVSAYASIISMPVLPNIVTNSWGGFEDTWWNLYGPSWQSASALENYFMALSSMGVTIVAASGDSGGFDTSSGVLSAEFPASSPYVLSVGGVRTVAESPSGTPFPATPSFYVNVTLAPYGYSEVNSLPVWYPNYTLSGSYVKSLGPLSYWYYSLTPITRDIASGGIGLSYWFNQPWWQHGPGIPDTARRMVADISAEADFNMTVYFAGAWNFFWGGTSFAAPTVAGALSLLISYLQRQFNTSFSLGLPQPLLYKLYNDQKLPLPPYYTDVKGQNTWDYIAADENYGWPGGQNWTPGWASAGTGYNLLSGLGVPDVYNMAEDAYLLLNTHGKYDALHLILNNSVPQQIQGGRTYTFQVINSSGVAAKNVSVEMEYISVNGTVTFSNLTTNSTGYFMFNATSLHGYVSVYMVSSISTGFDYFWISRAPVKGTLSLRILSPSHSLMGGFSLFNGLLSPYFPAIAPVMPNIAVISVTLHSGNSSVPVYNAYVVATALNATPFSSPPASGNKYYDSKLLSYSPLRSESYTNLSGIAFVETWNVPTPQRYEVNASFDGLNATAYLNITPQLIIRGLSSSSKPQVIGNSSYVHLGAENTLLAPYPEGNLRYVLSVQVLMWNGTPVSGARAELGLISGEPGIPAGIKQTATVTNASGIASFLITTQLASLETQNDSLLVVEVFNASYPSLYSNSYSGALPVETNYSLAALLFTSPAVGIAQTLMDTPEGYVSTSFVGTVGNYASFYISLSYLDGGQDNITHLYYTIDNGSAQPVPLPSVGQQSFQWTVKLPALSIGAHMFVVHFADTLGFQYSIELVFHVIGVGDDPAPSVHFLSPSQDSFVTGFTTLTFTVGQSQYLIQETLTVDNSTYDVMGLSSFSFNASLFPGIIRITLEAVNINGVYATAVLNLYSVPDPVPSAEITAPSENATFIGGSLTVGLYYSGYFLKSESILLSGPFGTHIFNVTGQNSLKLQGLMPGSYRLTYTVTGLDGMSSSVTVNFTVLSYNQSARDSEILFTIAYVLSFLLFISGILTGIYIERRNRKRRF
jgi:kumamolisin